MMERMLNYAYSELKWQRIVNQKLTVIAAVAIVYAVRSELRNRELRKRNWELATENEELRTREG